MLNFDVNICLKLCSDHKSLNLTQRVLNLHEKVSKVFKESILEDMSHFW